MNENDFSSWGSNSMKEEFLNAMSKAANSVTVVTTDGDAGRVGVTVSAMCSVSADGPAPSLLVCVHEQSPACAAISRNRVFCANLLGAEQSYISDSFAGRSGLKGEDKFDCAVWLTQATGAPVLQASLASFDCHLQQEFQIGTHKVFIGKLAHVTCDEVRKPLVYHDRSYGMPQSLSSVSISA